MEVGKGALQRVMEGRKEELREEQQGHKEVHTEHLGACLASLEVHLKSKTEEPRESLGWQRYLEKSFAAPKNLSWRLKA
jgi:hypothetical protein